MVYQYFFLCLVTLAFSSVAALPYHDGRIVKGMSMNIKQAPYLVRILISGAQCAGSLIAPRYVVTASHCVKGKNLSALTVVANVTKISEVGIRRNVMRMESHPEFSKRTGHSDVAVLELDEPIHNMKTLQLCLQPLSENDTIQVSGWGTAWKYGPESTVLQTVFLPVRSKELCDQEYSSYVVKNTFCAGGIEVGGSCTGDSGSPAVFKGQICGVSSFSWKCTLDGKAEVYTDIHAVRDFINNFMTSTDLDVRSRS